MNNDRKVNWSIHEWDSCITIREGKHMVCRCSKNVRGKKYATFIKTAPEMYEALRKIRGSLAILSDAESHRLCLMIEETMKKASGEA